MGSVQPVTSELAVRRAAALGNLVLVVWKDEVDATTVEVEVLAEVFENHGAALQVPPGTTLTPGAGPEIRPVFWLASFPENEIGEGVPLVLIAVRDGGGLGGTQAQFAVFEVGEAAVVSVGADFEIDAAIG